MFLPLNAPKKGDKKPFLLLPMPSGDLYRMNPFDYKNTNFNGIVFAKSGHGKSAMIHAMLAGSLTYGAMITIMDVGLQDQMGGTYKPLCKLVDGAYIQFASGQTSINPMELSTEIIFGEFNEKDFGDPDDMETPFTKAQIFAKLKETAKEILFTMVTGGNTTDQDLLYIAKLNNALTRFYDNPGIRARINAAHRAGLGTEEWSKYPILEDFIYFIEVEDKDSDVGGYMKMILSDIYCNGLESQIFNRPSNFDLENNFMVFDFKGVTKSLWPPVVVLALAATARRNFRTSNNPKMLIFDEGGALIKIPSAAELTEESYTTGRKAGVSNWFIATDYEQVMKSPSWAGIKANADNIFLGQVASQSVRTVETELMLPSKYAEMLSGQGFSRNRKGGYSPWLHIRNSDEYEIVLNKPPIAMMWLAANEGEEKLIKQRYMSLIGDPYVALTLLAADYPRYAEGGLVLGASGVSYLDQYLQRKAHHTKELVHA
jgi:conjugal transfer ATP-binding protein TraC